MTADDTTELAADAWPSVEYVMGRAQLPGRPGDAEITVTMIGRRDQPIVTWTWRRGAAGARSVAAITPGLVLEMSVADDGALEASAWERGIDGARILVAAASARRAGRGWTQLFAETGAMPLPPGVRDRLERYLFA